MSQCNAELHSEDGKDSLVFSSNKLFCLLDKGHKEKLHKFYGGQTSENDCRERCDCPRCNDNHLGNSEEIVCFTIEMNNQLQKHRMEKPALRNVHPIEVRGMLLPSIEGRLKRIALSKNKEDRIKQCVHIANEIMMIWIKENE